MTVGHRSLTPDDRIFLAVLDGGDLTRGTVFPFDRGT